MSDKDILELQGRVSALESLVIDLLAIAQSANAALLDERRARGPEMSAGPDGRHRALKEAAVLRRARLIAPALDIELSTLTGDQA
jgi:hypothetical protein